MDVSPKPSSLVRAGGLVLAAVLPGRMPRRTAAQAAVLAGTGAVARQIDPLGLSPITIGVADHAPTWQRVLAEGVVPNGSWAVEGVLVLRGLRRLPGPRWLVVIGAGAVVYTGDHVLNAKLTPLVERAKQMADKAPDAAETENALHSAPGDDDPGHG